MACCAACWCFALRGALRGARAVRTVSLVPGADARELVRRQRHALLDMLEERLERDIVRAERRRRAVVGAALDAALGAGVLAVHARLVQLVRELAQHGRDGKREGWPV